MHRSRLVFALLLTHASACDTPAEDTPVPCEPAAREPVRRLSAFEYQRTLRELVGFEVDEGTLPPSSISTTFATEDDALGSSALLVDGQFDAAEAAAETVLQRLKDGGSDAFLGCEAEAPTCIEDWLARFATTAFRRPVEQDELSRLRALLDEISLEQGVEVAIAATVEAVILSPRFGFHAEERDASGAPDDWSIASRMSYFLWAGPPDEELLGQAAAGSLRDADTRSQQAQRMLLDPRAREGVVRVYRELLDLEQLATLAPETDAYPMWTETLRSEISAESDAFIGSTVLDREGTLEALLVSRYVEAGPELSELYGISTDAAEVNSERAGILTRAGFLAAQSHETQPSPVFRGLAVLDRLACRDFSVPEGIPDVGSPEPSTTNRQRFEQHSVDPACSGCHSQIDPIGFTFEKFDSIGGYRTVDNGQPVDDSGAFLGVEVANATELSEVMAQSHEVLTCSVTQWLRFNRGHEPLGGETCARDNLADRFIASGGDLRGMLVDIVESDLFIQ